MSIAISNTTGYILAGGKSSRMGEDKGLKIFNGKYLVQIVIEQMQMVFNQVVIVSNNLDYQQFGLEVIEDEVKNIGPAGGIYTALQHSKTDKNFIISCDMPFVTAEAITFVLKSSENAEITLPAMNGKLEPLFGVYSKKCLPKWKALIDNDCIKLQNMITNFNLKIMGVSAQVNFSEKIFRNLNTPNEFKNALNNV